MDNLAGAFGSIIEPAATVAARNASAQALGAYGLPQELNPFAPPPTTPANPAVSAQPTANQAKEDQQGAGSSIMGLVKRYWKVGLLVVGLVVVGGWLLKRRK
jgi:hypothetical protein